MRLTPDNMLMGALSFIRWDDELSAFRRFACGLIAGAVVVAMGLAVRLLVEPTSVWKVTVIVNVSWWVIYAAAVVVACMPLSRYRASFFASLGATGPVMVLSVVNQVEAYRAGDIVRWWVIPMLLPITGATLLAGTFAVASLATWIRLRMSPVFPEGCCQKCGYCLFGLPRARCPECGYQPRESPSPEPDVQSEGV